MIMVNCQARPCRVALPGRRLGSRRLPADRAYAALLSLHREVLLQGDPECPTQIVIQVLIGISLAPFISPLGAALLAISLDPETRPWEIASSAAPSGEMNGASEIPISTWI